MLVLVICLLIPAGWCWLDFFVDGLFVACVTALGLHDLGGVCGFWV